MTEPTTNPDNVTPLLPPMELRQASFFPRLGVEDRALLRPAAYAVVRAALTAAQAAQSLATTTPTSGFWQASVCSAVSAVSAIASGACLLGASVALALTTDPGDDDAPPAAAPVAVPPAPPASTGSTSNTDTNTTKES